MGKTITIANYNRPEHTRRCIEALHNQQGISKDEWTVIFGVDGGGGKETEMVSLYQSIQYKKSGYILGANIGVNANTYTLMFNAYELNNSELNIYLEDDIILSPDALRMAEWFYPQRNDYGGLSFCNIKQKSGDDTNRLYETKAFIGWGFAMGLASWRKYAKDIWLQGASMWDNKLAQNIRDLGGKNLIPEKSRATNVGRIGVHFSPEHYDGFMKGHTYLEEYKQCEYQK